MILWRCHGQCKCYSILLFVTTSLSILNAWNVNTKTWKKSCFRFSERSREEDFVDKEDEPDEDIESMYKNMGSKVRLRARVAYDGTRFQGWQFQNHGITIQGEIESVLNSRFSRHVRIIGAGRTDAGVHARGQAFHFDLYEKEIYRQKTNMANELQNSKKLLNIDEVAFVQSEFLNQLQQSLNSMLPRDIRIWNLSMGPSVEVSTPNLALTTYKWHAMASSKAKLYCYRLSLQPGSITLDPLQRFSRVHIPDPVNVVYLQTLLKHFEGTHDFRAFAGAVDSYQRKIGSTAMEKNTIRTIYNITLVDESSLGSSFGNYRIDFILQGALFKMVRNIVGTVLDVAKGKMHESVLLQLLLQNSTRKDNKCKPAAPEGLTLEHVFYDDENF